MYVDELAIWLKWEFVTLVLNSGVCYDGEKTQYRLTIIHFSSEMLGFADGGWELAASYVMLVVTCIEYI